jgi:hypothetical protein
MFATTISCNLSKKYEEFQRKTTNDKLKKMYFSVANLKVVKALTIQSVYKLSNGMNSPGFEAEAKDVSLLRNIQTDFGPTQPPIQWLLEFFLGSKAAGK